MPQLSAPIIPVLAPFRPLFAPRTWPNVLLLVRGTLLVRGRRTVAAALRVMGHAPDPHFTPYHQVLNRAAWSSLAVSHVLLLLLLTTFLPADALVEVVIDEHLERRWGPRIRQRGRYRDPLLSGKHLAVSTSGWRWICCMLLVPLPWTDSVWALPFLTILTTPPPPMAPRDTATRPPPSGPNKSSSSYAAGCPRTRSRSSALEITA